ncbi:MAG: hypothetical protein AAF570_21690 [Bacteroidota bacterium]
MYEVPSPESNVLLEKIDGIDLVQLGRSALPDFIEFVFGIFKTQFAQRFKMEISEREYDDFVTDEKSFAGNGMYAAILVGNPGRIVGGFRAARYDRSIGFPTERIFNVSVPVLAEELGTEPESIWHGGCFAMDTKWLLQNGFNVRKIVRRIYFHSLASMVKNHAAYIIGETDELIERLHARNGFQWRPISDWAEYWGSTRATLLNVEEAAAGRLYCEELKKMGLLVS